MQLRAIAILCLFLASLAGAQEPTWTVNFKDSDIEEVIKFVANATSKTIVVDPRVKGRVKVISAEPLAAGDLYDLFLSVLEVHGFTAVEIDGVVQIVPKNQARSSPIPSTPGNFSSGYETRVVELRNVSVSKLLPVLRPLVAQHAHLAQHEPSNALVVSDTSANIERIIKIARALDEAAKSEAELIKLKHASAEEVVNILTKLQGKEGAVLVADARTNSIVASGDELRRDKIRTLIEHLDQPQDLDGNVRVVYLEYAEAKKVAEVLTKLATNMDKAAPGGAGGKAAAAKGSTSIEADEDTNSLLITADPNTMQSLLAVVAKLDIRRAQVLVEAIIVELNDTAGKNLGIQWLFADNDVGFGSSIDQNLGGVGGIAAAALDDGDDRLEDLARALAATAGQTFGTGNIGDGTDFIAIISALQSHSGANILSTPSLLTTDNHEASISVGQNVPFLTGSTPNIGSGGGTANPFQTIQRQSVGTSLKITPQINEGDKLILDIVQEQSSLTRDASASDIITNERKIETQVLAKDGQTLILGGLMSDQVDDTVQKVPLLGSIPILGHLFRTETAKVTKNNLLVFLRATIIRDDETLDGATAEKYRVIRDMQLKRQEDTGLMIRGKELPLLPVWEGDEPSGGKEEGEE